MPIKTHSPEISVVLTKTIERQQGVSERYKDLPRELQLSPYLGESGSVVTHKSKREGSGTFTLTLTTEAVDNAGDSLYGLIEPMDHVEIRMAHDGYKSAGDALPIVMRGFVSRISISEGMNDDGTPHRQVVVTGHDYGKLLERFQIFFEKNYLTGLDVLTQFKQFINYGVEYRSMEASEFISVIIENIVTPFLSEIGFVNFDIEDIQVDATVRKGVVAPHGAAGAEGTLWSVMKRFSDLYWNELFIEDREDGVFIVYRPMPLKDLQGKLILDDAVDPGSVRITNDDIISRDLSRSDDQVANYYWVVSTRNDLHNPGALRIKSIQGGAESYFLQTYPNSALSIYGLRKMEVDTDQDSTSQVTQGRNLPAAEAKKASELTTSWVTDRREDLIKMNRDNVVYEDGSLTLKGNERVRAGIYLLIDYGAYIAEYYVVSVEQKFEPFRRFVTVAQVERGTGFLERSQQQAPYLDEHKTGVYR